MNQTKRIYDSPRQAARREAILECARQSLSKLGYEGLTMRGLAREVGVATSTLYNLYGNKDDLLLAAVDALLVELAQSARAANKEGIDALLILEEVSTAQIQKTPLYADAMTRSLLRVGADRRLAEVLFASSLPYITEHLKLAKARGELKKDTDVDNIAMHLVGQQWGTVLLWLMGLLPLKNLAIESKRAQIMILANVVSSSGAARLNKYSLER